MKIVARHKSIRQQKTERWRLPFWDWQLELVLVEQQLDGSLTSTSSILRKGSYPRLPWIPSPQYRYRSLVK